MRQPAAGPDFAALANPGVRTLEPYKPGKSAAQLRRVRAATDALKLASNENPLGASPRALTAAQAALPGIGRYPDSSGQMLKTALAEHLGVAAEQITLGCGSNDILVLMAQCFLSPAASAVYSRHAFIVYPLAVCVAGARALTAPARDWGHDLDAMAALVQEDTRLVYMANPNNPTGTWVDETALTAFLEQLPPTVILVLDEAYFEYAQRPGYPDSLRLQQRFPNLVVTRTFSKVHGLAGLRIGYSISHPQIADLLNRVRQPFNVNTAAQAAAQAALEDEAHVAASLECNREGMALLEEGLRGLGLPCIPSAANFIAFETPGQKPGKIYEALQHQGIIVRPVEKDYQMSGHLRVSVGRVQECRRFLRALKEVLAQAG